ncbi:MAG: ribosomal RNA large subunit methyltransferase H [Saprospiraceae bacterium]|nr:MAG: ribosomal RNA large subunit methyltransferase H [Saprospiraceae bacterium]
MKVSLWLIGKTNESYLDTGISIFQKRLERYLPFNIETWPDVKNAAKFSPQLLKEKEGEMILDKLKKEDFLILLDEKGKMYSSEDFAKHLEQLLQRSHRRLIFLVGGAYGFSNPLYERANAKIALSKMTFSHQMVRLFFVEQLYRALTILKNEPYHNS